MADERSEFEAQCRELTQMLECVTTQDVQAQPLSERWAALRPMEPGAGALYEQLTPEVLRRSGDGGFPAAKPPEEHDLIRLQFAVTLMGIRGSDRLLAELLAPGGEDRIRAIRIHGGGVRSAAFEEDVIVLLPEISDPSRMPIVVDGLLGVFDRTRYQRNWILDCSALMVESPVFTAALAMHARGLETYSRRLLVCWLRESLLLPLDRKFLGERLKLRSVGGYLFSQREPRQT